MLTALSDHSAVYLHQYAYPIPLIGRRDIELNLNDFDKIEVAEDEDNPACATRQSCR
jgi:hypothetical protein